MGSGILWCAAFFFFAALHCSQVVCYVLNWSDPPTASAIVLQRPLLSSSTSAAYVNEADFCIQVQKHPCLQPSSNDNDSDYDDKRRRHVSGSLFPQVRSHHLELLLSSSIPWSTVGLHYICACINKTAQKTLSCTTPSEFFFDAGLLYVIDDTTAVAFSPVPQSVRYPLNQQILAHCKAGISCMEIVSKLVTERSTSDRPLIIVPYDHHCDNKFDVTKLNQWYDYGLQDFIDGTHNVWDLSRLREPGSRLALPFLLSPGIWRVCQCTPGALTPYIRLPTPSTTNPATRDCHLRGHFHDDLGVVVIFDRDVVQSHDNQHDFDDLPSPPRAGDLSEGLWDLAAHVAATISSTSSSAELRMLPSTAVLSSQFRKFNTENSTASLYLESTHHSVPSIARELQSTDDGRLSADIANRNGTAAPASRKNNGVTRCVQDTDCLNRFGTCENSMCRGFIPDLKDERIIKCVDGYRCTLKPGELPGVAVSSDFQVIGIRPTEKCGGADPLKSTQSIFANSNRWECEDSQSDSCVFTAGVGMRLNRTADVEGIRLCGCPNTDGDGNQHSCDHRREFFVPLGLLTVQECLRNAHCIDHQFAYCVNGHCAGPSGVAAGAGLRVFQCVTSRDCDIKAVTEKTVQEALKVLPITANFSCGAGVALDPDLIDDNALPCIVDINNDGHCDINLGLPRTLGTTRLCGCSGDKGGNGRDCDQLEDFDHEIAMVEVGECIIDDDCPNVGEVCVDSKCFRDNYPPYVVRVRPGNNSYAVPPVNEVVLTWNENVKFTKANRKLVIACTNCEVPKKWELEVRDTSTYKIAQTGYSITLKGREMRIVPDITMASFPEGKYVLGYEGGIVADVFENFNKGAIDITFTVSKTVGCPFLYITGFSTSEINLNGLYTSVEPISGHAAWRGGASQDLFLYWKTEDQARNQPGNWILSPKADERNFVGYSDLKMMASLGREGEIRPPTGTWKKWQGRRWVEHPDVIIHCRTSADRTFPKLIEIHPKIAETSVPLKNTTVFMRFSEPMTYGHWGNISFVARDADQEVVIVPDFEAGMRGKYIKSDGSGVVQLYLQGLNSLLPGEVYDIVANVGCLTDLAYNPWGPVEPGVLYFTTYGMPCEPLPSLGPAYVVKGDQHQHGSTVQIHCAEGYTSPQAEDDGIALQEEKEDDAGEVDVDAMTTVQATQATTALSTVTKKNEQSSTQGFVTIQCVDGQWQDIHLQCKANCPRHTDLGPQYVVEGMSGVSRHGTRVKVSCAKTTVIVEGTGTAELVCNDGRWGTLALRCGATCGLFPSLGPSYHVDYDNNAPGSTSSVVGSRRTVRCSSTAERTRGREPAYVVCEEKGWSTLDLECHTPCQELPMYSESYHVTGSGNNHGDYRNITCARGFRGMTAAEKPLHGTSVFCNEGRWEQEEEFSCMKDCGEFDKGSGYSFKPIKGDIGAHNSTILVWCADDAIHESGPMNETLRCYNGNWDLGSVICHGPCRSPEEVLGRSYISYFTPGTVTNQDGRFPHGTTGFLYCAAESLITSGSPPEHIACSNGAWIPAESTEAATALISTSKAMHSFSDRPRLVCSSSCGPFSKDLERYVGSSGGSVNLLLPHLSVPPGSTGALRCLNGFSPTDTRHPEGIFTCENGRWVDHEEFTCVPTCGPTTLGELFQRNYDLKDASITSLDHNATAEVTCRHDASIRLGSSKEKHLKVRCYAGHLIFPSVVCAIPTCSDQIQNGQEEGIDCGGPDCRPCNNCELHRPNCVPSCHDNVKNGQEEDIDCGGPDCPPCRYCMGLPPSLQVGMRFSLNAGSAYHSVTPTASRSVKALVGSQLDVTCDKGYEQVSAAPLLRFQSYQCVSEEWDLVDGSQQFVLECVEPRCDDQKMNGDEWGIDCGGSCPNSCPSCNDGIQNQDEEAVDCGGTHCLPCSSCSIGPFKTLNTKTVRMDLVEANNVTHEIVELWNLTGTEHGSRRRITCRERPDSFITIQCNNGGWQRYDGEGSLYQLKCDGGLMEFSNAYAFANDQIRVFRAPTFPLPRQCTTIEGTRQDLNDCCDVMTKFNHIIAGECGALLFGSKSAQVKGFCKGSCFSQLETLLDSYSHLALDHEACPSYSILVEMMRSFCHKGVQPPSTAGTTLDTSNDPEFYCFAAAADALHQLKNLEDLRGVQLEAACATDSCFETNLRYFELSRDLYVLSQELALLPSKSELRRHLRDETYDDDAFTVLVAATRAEEQINSLRHRVVRWLLSMPDFVVSFPANVSVSSAPPGRRRLDIPSASFVAGAATSPALKEWLTVSRFSRQLLTFMCLKDSNEHSCASTVSQFIVADTESAASSPSSSTSGRLFEDQPCTNKCLMLVTRHLGQTLLDEGRALLRPYTAMLGLLMRSYGRVSCQKSSFGMSCSEVFGTTMGAGTPLSGRGFDSSTLKRKHDAYPSCKCPITYIGDGRCDPECFNPLCGFDEEDCLFEKMFPLAYQRLTSLVPLSNACHPFNRQFDCSSRRPTRQGPADCHSLLIDVVNSDGCCAASRWNVLRESLSLDRKLRQLSLLKSSNATTEAVTTDTFDLYPTLMLARSSAWIESTCDVTLDSTCSRGLRRSAVRLGFTFQQLNFAAMFGGTSGDLFRSAMVDTLREVLSDTLAVPSFDITEIRLWPGSVVAEIIVDPGLAVAEVMKDLKAARDSGELARRLDDGVAGMLEDLKARGISTSQVMNHPKSERAKRRRLQNTAPDVDDLHVDDIIVDWTTVQQPQLSVVKSPTLPVAGTLDMDDLTASLRNPSCSDNVDLSPPPDAQGPGQSTVYYVDPMYGFGTTHGSTRQVSCAEGYAPSANNSGPSPQFLRCDRGRWISAVPGEPRLVCRTPCGPYESWDKGLDRTSITVLSDGLDVDGAKRVVSCNAGYSPAPGATSPQTLRCHSGAWDRRSLECVRTDLASHALQNAECGDTRLVSVLEPPDVFVLKQVYSGTINVGDILPTAGLISMKRPTAITLWSLRCVRGYIPTNTSVEVAPVFCVNGTLLGSNEFRIPDWDAAAARVPQDKLQLEVLRQYFAYIAMSHDEAETQGDFVTPLVDTHHISAHLPAPEVVLAATNMSSFSTLSNDDNTHATLDSDLLPASKIVQALPGQPFHFVECAPDVRIPPWLSPSQPGMSNALFYTLVFGGSCTALMLGMLFFYCKKTHCMAKPFFDHHHEGKVLPSNETTSEGGDSSPSSRGSCGAHPRDDRHHPKDVLATRATDVPAMSDMGDPIQTRQSPFSLTHNDPHHHDREDYMFEENGDDDVLEVDEFDGGGGVLTSPSSPPSASAYYHSVYHYDVNSGQARQRRSTPSSAASQRYQPASDVHATRSTSYRDGSQSRSTRRRSSTQRASWENDARSMYQSAYDERHDAGDVGTTTRYYRSGRRRRTSRDSGQSGSDHPYENDSQHLDVDPADETTVFYDIDHAYVCARYQRQPDGIHAAPSVTSSIQLQSPSPLPVTYDHAKEHDAMRCCYMTHDTHATTMTQRPLGSATVRSSSSSSRVSQPRRQQQDEEPVRPSLAARACQSRQQQEHPGQTAASSCPYNVSGGGGTAASTIRRSSIDTSSAYSESAASSFYSELEVDFERLREFRAKHPGFDRQVVQGLKSWRSTARVGGSGGRGANHPCAGRAVRKGGGGGGRGGRGVLTPYTSEDDDDDDDPHQESKTTRAVLMM